MLILLRSAVFNALFYLNLIALLLVAIPTLLMPRWGILRVAKAWGASSLWLVRVVCGLRVEWRGLEKLPPGGYLVAAKHQSIWETFALLTRFSDPAFIVKRELMRIPFFGWYLGAADMIPIDRQKGASTIPALVASARQALAEERQLIFPEGTRRQPGAEPAYKFGISRLYTETGAICVPVALNSGLFWPRRKFLRFPGTVIVEVLDPIEPGLDAMAFFERLQGEIERASDRLIAEARGSEAPERQSVS